MTAERKQQIINAITEKAHIIVPDSAKIILFGSQARGDAHEGSDWDILILLDKERITLKDIDEVSYPLRELGWDLNEDINTILYTKDYWEKNTFIPFFKNITEEGIEL